MRTPNKARGARRIKPIADNKTRHTIVSAKNMVANMSKTAFNIASASISQTQLVVKDSLISALSTIRNADLLVKLSERFTKRKNNE